MKTEKATKTNSPNEAKGPKGGFLPYHCTDLNNIGS